MQRMSMASNRLSHSTEVISSRPKAQPTIAHAEPEQAKALPGILIADLRVKQPQRSPATYRVGAPVVARRRVRWTGADNN